MRFNEFFDLMNELSDVDSENFNNSEIELIDDMDLGCAFSYKLDATKMADEQYLEEMEELIDSYVSDFKFEDDVLIFILN